MARGSLGGEQQQQPLLRDAERGSQGAEEDDAQSTSGSGVLEQTGQIARSAANLVKNGTGTSTVSMPQVVRTLGVGVTLGAMLIQSVLHIVAHHAISRESDREGVSSYHDLLKARFGKWGGRAVAAAQTLNSLGKLVVWLIVLADIIVGSPPDHRGLLPELLGRSGEEASEHWWMRRAPWIVLLTLLSLPVVSIKSLDKLSAVSALGNVAVAGIGAAGVGLAVAAGRAGEAHTIRWLPSLHEMGAKSMGRAWLEVLSTLPVVLGAGLTEGNVNTMMGQLHPYSQGAMDASAAASRITTIAIFLLIGVSNYIAFGTDLHPDVLMNYTRHDLKGLISARTALWLASAVRFAFLLNGLVSLPLYCYPMQKNMWAALPNQSPEERLSDRRSFALTNYITLAGCCVVAILVPDIWRPLKLIGATAAASIAFLFPAAVVLSVGRARTGTLMHAFSWVLLGVGLFQAVVGVASQFF